MTGGGCRGPAAKVGTEAERDLIEMGKLAAVTKPYPSRPRPHGLRKENGSGDCY